MKIAVIAGFMACSIAVDAWGREWTSTSGSKLEAEFVEAKQGTVILEKADGSKVRISQSRLSMADREHIRSLTTKTAEPTKMEQPEPTEPVVESGFVGGPEFRTKEGELTAGTAFLVSVEGQPNPLLITAQHIFGPAGGLREDIPRSEMARFTSRVTLRDLVRRKEHSTKVELLPMPDNLDVAVFQTSLKSKITPHPFAAERPKQGEPIWLVASLQDQPEDKILHRGIVVNIWADKLKCKFDDGNLVMRGASGAPYLNLKGEVVGLHTGSYKDPGNIAGAVIPADNIRNAIEQALKK